MYQVTMYTLPFSHKRGQYVQSRIIIFWCISRDNLYNYYIHRPKVHFSINGVIQFTAKLVYPSSTNSPGNNTQNDSEDMVMEENILLGGSAFHGCWSQVLLWKDSFNVAPDYLSEYIGEMEPNVKYQIIIPSIPINRNAMYNDNTTKKRRFELK